MIDLHNHILPAVDDGAADIDESVEIARQFAAEGVTMVAATPHRDPLRGTGPDAPAVRRLVEDVQSAISTARCPLSVVVGHELFLTPDAVNLLRSGAVATLGDNRFVLVEVSLTALERPLYLDETLFRLQLSGYGPILAHPERYAFVQRDTASVDNLVARGIALQVTAPSLLGEYGGAARRTAMRLLERGSYALAASDRHHPGSRRSLAALQARLTELGGEPLAELLLVTNPGRVLAGRDPIPADPLPQRAGILTRLFFPRAHRRANR